MDPVLKAGLQIRETGDRLLREATITPVSYYLLPGDKRDAIIRILSKIDVEGVPHDPVDIKTLPELEEWFLKEIKKDGKNKD